MRRFFTFILFGLLILAFMFKAEAHDEYWKQRTSLFEVLPIGTEDIVFLGNSITDGGEFHELLERPDVKNRGIRSDVIEGVRERLDQVTRWHPSKIFLLIGINDISHGQTVESLSDKYEELVKEIREQSPDTRLYIQSVMPINNSFNRYKALKGRENIIPLLNNELKEIAEKNGAVYINLWPALEDSKGRLKKEFTFDGLHLNGKGYKAWMSIISKYID
ncbi:MAG: hypothetical protein K2N03_04170 [Muribaculaceae bacterium]|nr:hypothetical protein [Muribaculaceae bacterium]